MDDGRTLEVTRCCTDGTTNACTKLYGAVRRAAAALGYVRLLTTTGASEGGASLRAAGWEVLRETPGRSWSVPSRPRDDKHELGPRTVWVMDLGNDQTEIEPIIEPDDSQHELFGT
jgi:hypothetical protein